MDFGSFVLAVSTDRLSDRVIEATRRYADAIEFRLDRATTPQETLTAYDGDLPLIATNRSETEGGKAADTPERIRLLEAAAEHPAVEAIDIELATLDAGARPTVPREVATIASVHDFDKTPPKETLETRLRAAAEAGTVGKLAVRAKRPRDVLRLLSVTDSVAGDEATVATMAMGPVGQHSRLIAPIYGSRIGYAPPTAAEATAPGQLDVETFATLRRELHPT